MLCGPTIRLSGRCVTRLALLGALAAAYSLACKSRESVDTKKTEQPVTEDDRRSLSLKKFTAKREHKNFQKQPKLPKLLATKLLEAGAEPRAELRYRLDDKERAFTVTAKVETRDFADGRWSQWMALPAATIGLGIRRSGADNALWVLDLRGLPAAIGEGPGDGAARAALDGFLERYRSFLERRRAQLPLTDRGRPGSPSLSPDARMSKDSAHISTEFTQILLESVVPLPEEAVGVGARWQVVSLLYRGRSAVKQTAEYQLVRAADNRLTLQVQITQVGEHQVIDAPELPAGHTAELVALFFRIAGEVELDLGLAPTPISGELTTETRVHGRMVSARGRQDHSIESRGTLVLRTATAE